MFTYVGFFASVGRWCVSFDENTLEKKKKKKDGPEERVRLALRSQPQQKAKLEIPLKSETRIYKYAAFVQSTAGPESFRINAELRSNRGGYLVGSEDTA